MNDIDHLAQEIRRVDGAHTLGAGALAEALGPFIEAVRAEAREQADREPRRDYPDAKVPASVAPAVEENALVEVVATWLEQFMPTPYVPFSDRFGLARTILAAGFRSTDREPSEREVEAAAKAAYDRAFLKHAPEYVDRWDDLVVDNDEAAESWREVARAALIAAREVNRGH